MNFPKKKQQGTLVENSILYILPPFFFLYLLSLAVIMRSLLFGIAIVSIALILIFNRYKKNSTVIKNDIHIYYLNGIFLSSHILFIIRSFFKQYFSILFLIVLYSILMLSVITWGIPNNNHPFMYHMDEWHQMNSIRELFSKGTSNVPGAANGPVFQFYLSGLYLAPFIMLRILHPFSITSSLTQIGEQEKLFIILRFQTLVFGLGSIFLISIIAKKYFRMHPFLPAFFFTINPLWLSLSNYFKYDIALMFWILCSLFFIFKFINTKFEKTFYLACILSGIATATKISALPLLMILLCMYLLLIRSTYKHLFVGILLYFITLLFLGFPDLLFLRGSYFEFFQSNLVSNPPLTANYVLGMPYPIYLLINQWPTNFGYALIILSFFGLIYILHLVYKYGFIKLKKFSYEKILLIGFGWFFISLIPLRLFSSGNRSLVLLPFLAIFAALVLNAFFLSKEKSLRYLTLTILGVFLLFQMLESLVWIQLKWQKDPRFVASEWIQENIDLKETIGVENAPIYQMIPDVLLQSFYEQQHGDNNKYNIKVVDEHTEGLPLYIVVTNADMIPYIRNTSEQKLLQKTIVNYFVEKVITPDFTYLHLFHNTLSFSIPNIVPMPTSIIILKRKGGNFS